MQDVASLFKRTVVGVALLLSVLYLGDYLSVTYASHDQLDKVQITKFYAVPQKDGKTSYEPAEPETQTCVNSIFPHFGYNPCWYLKRHKTQQINL
jgi:hypothetical protein